jgi:hypothetical protein
LRPEDIPGRRRSARLDSRAYRSREHPRRSRSAARLGTRVDRPPRFELPRRVSCDRRRGTRRHAARTRHLQITHRQIPILRSRLSVIPSCSCVNSDAAESQLAHRETHLRTRRRRAVAHQPTSARTSRRSRSDRRWPLLCTCRGGCHPHPPMRIASSVDARARLRARVTFLCRSPTSRPRES